MRVTSVRGYSYALYSSQFSSERKVVQPVPTALYLVYCYMTRIKCRERTQRVATSGSRTSGRAGTPRSRATKPRPHAPLQAKNGRGCLLAVFSFSTSREFYFRKNDDATQQVEMSCGNLQTVTQFAVWDFSTSPGCP